MKAIRFHAYGGPEVLQFEEISVPEIKCEASACSTGVAVDKKLGINGFQISGCDSLFNFTKLSRKINTVFTDVTEKIHSHCGSDAYRIDSIVPERVGSEGSIKLILLPLK